jgi:hypothetical protein
MVNDINTITLSGEVGWVKKNYTKAGTIYINFALKQRNIEFKDKVMVGKSDDYYFIQCFSEVAAKVSGIREGDIVVMTGKITPFTPEKGKASINIIAEKVVRYGNKSDDNDRNKEQAPG